MDTKAAQRDIDKFFETSGYVFLDGTEFENNPENFFKEVKKVSNFPEAFLLEQKIIEKTNTGNFILSYKAGGLHCKKQLGDGNKKIFHLYR